MGGSGQMVELAAADMATEDDLRSFAALCRPAVIQQGFSDWPAVAAECVRLVGGVA